jgi:monoamine oxidase
MTSLSRRTFLELLARTGSAPALMQAAVWFGMTPAKADEPVLSGIRPVQGKPKVLILGAGISGLVAAYELGKAGYECTILEASHRAGGRNLTLRHGDLIDELGNPQICPFDDEPHLYFNAGAARISAHHTGIMHYCRELGVEMMLFNNHNKNCYTQDDAAFDGKPVRIGNYETDARGFLSELMAKSLISLDKLDAPFNVVDKELLVRFMDHYGDLGSDHRYHGSSRSWYNKGGILDPGELNKPLSFKELMKSHFWSTAMHFAEMADQAGAMLTPVGGMDHIVTGFLRHVGDRVTLNAQVQRVQLLDAGVEVSYLQKGNLETVRADYCINCIPTQIMAGIDNNFPAPYRRVLASIQRGNLVKIGFQAKERFWEREGIFTGISWTTQDITQLWYPEHGTFKQKGVFLGAYTWDPVVAHRFTQLGPEQRLETAIRQGEKIHPGYRGWIENGISISWHRMNHMLGCDSHWSEELRKEGYALMQAPAGRHYMVGDQISRHGGWQEGAVRSAWHALEDIQRREQNAEAVNG